jgi:quercetin dioxygenase-like cupin family protein
VRVVSDVAKEYFREGKRTVVEDPEHPSLYRSIDDIPFVPLGDGLRFKPLFGKNLLVNYVYFDANTVAPVHQHAEEQIGTSIEGEFEFELNGVKQMIKPGIYYVVPPNVPHGARSFDKPCIALDIFSPPRSGFREMMDRVLEK